MPAPDDIDSLIELAAREVVRTPEGDLYGEDFRPYFNKWRTENNIEPGVTIGPTPSDMYRHFKQWMDSRGYELPETKLRVFGSAMRGIGFGRGRYYNKGRDTRPYIVSASTAAHLREWIKDNPTPPVGEGPFQPPYNAIRKKRKEQSNEPIL